VVSLESIAQDVSLSSLAVLVASVVRTLIFNLNPGAIGSRFPPMQRTQEWGTLSGDGPLAKTKAEPPRNSYNEFVCWLNSRKSEAAKVNE
jgi:hypothetical protein